MKFAEHLFTHLTSEWRSKYIQYDKLKDELYALVEDAPSDPELRKEYFAQRDEEFFQSCEQNLLEVNGFYKQQICAAESRLRSLRNDMVNAYNECAVKKMRIDHSEASNTRGRIRDEDCELIHYVLVMPKHRKIHDSLRTAFSEFYLSLILIQNFQELNATGFRKILKKHDKLFETTSGQEWRSTNVLPQEFVSESKVNDLIAEVENTYILAIEGGDRRTAMDRLRVPSLDQAAPRWTTFRLGVFLSAFFVLSALICLTAVFRERQERQTWWIPLRLYRGFFVFFVDLVLVGINHYGWQRAGVNSVLIFELDPRDHLHYQDIMGLGSLFLAFWATCVLGYLYHDLLQVPALIFPLILMLALLVWFLNPFRFSYWSARRWFFRKCRVLATPLWHRVHFADFWLADQLNSLVTILLDIEYFACFYVTQVDWSDMSVREMNNATDWGVDFIAGVDSCGKSSYGIRPLIAMTPAAIRFLQCIRRFCDSREKHPHLTNAGKYSTTFFVVMISTLYSSLGYGDLLSAESFKSPLVYLWFLTHFVSTAYTYAWDIRMDWGLCQFEKVKEAGSQNYQWEKFFLRDSLLIYPHKYYYLAMIEDFLLRLMWTLNLALHVGLFWHGRDILICVTALLECFRRFVWNFFRLENEHTNNCGNFRAVRDINIRVIPREGQAAQMKAKRRSSVVHFMNNLKTV